MFPRSLGEPLCGGRSLLLSIILFCTCILAACVSASAQTKAITLPSNIGVLVSESETIAQGWITSVTLEPHPQLKNLMTVAVTLQVEETMKGDSSKTLTFRQAVIDKLDQRQKMGYRTGQHILLMLIKPSPYGLTSPAGMEQGRFRIEPMGAGRLFATNGFGNAGLFRGLDSQLKSRSLRISPEIQNMIARPGATPAPLEHLKNLIRTLAAAGSTR